ncbi:MAG: hypothetical protein K1X89_16405 [Myxococcaceae bacterium]|nr:hypothetical protein [Myxococcaceae bacterium]
MAKDHTDQLWIHGLPETGMLAAWAGGALADAFPPGVSPGFPRQWLSVASEGANTLVFFATEGEWRRGKSPLAPYPGDVLGVVEAAARKAGFATTRVAGVYGASFRVTSSQGGAERAVLIGDEDEGDGEGSGADGPLPQAVLEGGAWKDVDDALPKVRELLAPLAAAHLFEDAFSPLAWAADLETREAPAPTQFWMVWDGEVLPAPMTREEMAPRFEVALKQQRRAEVVEAAGDAVVGGVKWAIALPYLAIAVAAPVLAYPYFIPRLMEGEGALTTVIVVAMAEFAFLLPVALVWKSLPKVLKALVVALHVGPMLLGLAKGLSSVSG